MSRMLCVVGVALVAVMSQVAGAEAATYCVASPPGCSGVSFSPNTIEQAVSQAVVSPADDVVQIGAGTFNNDVIDVPVNTGGTLLIEGQGATTVLTSNQSQPRPQIADAEATLRGVVVQVPAALSSGRGITVLRGVAESLQVQGSPTGTLGVVLGEGGRLRSSTVTLSGTGSVGVQTASGDGSVTDSTLTACTGVLNHGAGTTAAQRTQVLAATGYDADLGGLFVDTATHRFGGPCAANAAVSMRGAATAARLVRVTNLTAVGGGQAGSAGIRLRRDSGASAMTAEILSSVFTGYVSTLVRTAATATPPTATISASAIDEAQATAAGYLAGVSPNLDNPVTGFVDQPNGDFALTHASELVDRGEATGPLGASLTDLVGADRELEGKPNVNGAVGRRDIGAFEYAPGLPAVEGSATPEVILTGEDVAFDAVGDPGDEGEAITYEWAFEDGTTLPGASVVRSFDTSGVYTATVTATDAAGWTATAEAFVVVDDPPPPPPPDPTDPPDDGGDGGATETTDRIATTSTDTPVREAELPLSLSGRRVAFTRTSTELDRRGRVGVRMQCRESRQPCIGRLILTAARGQRTVRLGAVIFTIARDKVAMVRVPILRARLAMLRGTGVVSVSAAVTVAGGRPGTATLAVRRRP